jgi:carbamoyl-phosphate synthase large subunit
MGRTTLLSPVPDRSSNRAVVLVTSSGRRVALVNTLRLVAKSLNIDLRILACDRAPRNCPACLLADAAYQTVDPLDPNYIDSLLEICLIHRVTLILPTESAELAPLSRNRDRFASIGTAIAISSPEMVELISIPKDTEALLCAHGFGGTGAGAASNTSDGSRRFDVLMYFDQQAQLRATIPCERVVEGGVEVLVTRRCAAIAAMAEQLSRQFHGLSSIVSMDATLRRDGSVTVERLRAYLSESFEVAHRAGAEIMKWLLLEHCFGSTTISDEWQDGVQMIRYEAAVFVLPN